MERFYGRARVLVTVAFTAAMLFVYGFALFDRTRPWPAVGAGVAATVLFLWLLTRWLVPLWRTDRRLRKGRTSTAWYRPDPADGDEQAAAKDGQQDEVSAGSGQPSARSQPEASVGRGDG